MHHMIESVNGDCSHCRASSFLLQLHPCPLHVESRKTIVPWTRFHCQLSKLAHTYPAAACSLVMKLCNFVLGLPFESPSVYTACTVPTFYLIVFSMTRSRHVDCVELSLLHAVGTVGYRSTIFHSSIWHVFFMPHAMHLISVIVDVNSVTFASYLQDVESCRPTSSSRWSQQHTFDNGVLWCVESSAATSISKYPISKFLQ